MPNVPAQALLSVGSVFHGKYEVTGSLGVGGMAIVYEVVHRVTRRPLALKVMLPEILCERGMRARFEQEARITAGVDSDHIVDVLDAGVDDATGSAFLVMELLRGDDLEAVLRRRGPLPAEAVAELLAQIAPALDAVHAAGIVHRDLKPSNLFLVEAQGQPPRLKLLDFGIAKILADGGRTTRNLGTPLYMSPEQAGGDADIGPAADLYALAHAAYTLLVGAAYWAPECAAGGRTLFDKLEEGASDPATQRARAHGVELPAAFDAWFARATAVDPQERFSEAREMVRCLATALGADAAAPSMVAAPARRRPPRRWSGRLVALSMVMLGLGGASWAGARAFGSPSARVDAALAAPTLRSAVSAAPAPDPPASAAAAPSAVDPPRSAVARPLEESPPAQAEPAAPARPGPTANRAQAKPRTTAAAAPSPFGTAVY